MDILSPGISKDMYALCVKLIVIIDNIENAEVDRQGNSKASILVFLPGINEIGEVYKKLEEISESQQ